MKNKFLTMAVASALFAVVVLPSAMADETPTVTTSIGTGTFSLQGQNAWDGSDISLTGLSAPPTADTDVTFDAGATDNFILTDFDATAGATVQLAMSDSNWTYAGSTSQAADYITAEDMDVIANYNGSAVDPTIATDSSSATFNILTASTASTAQSSSSYAFHPDFSSATQNNAKELSTTAFSYFESDASAPYKGEMRIDRLELTIPAFAGVGDYSNVLYVTAVAGGDLSF